MGHGKVCFTSDMFGTGTRREAKWLYFQQKEIQKINLVGTSLKG